MKKTILASTILASISSFALAAPIPYVGAQLGYNDTSVETTLRGPEFRISEDGLAVSGVSGSLLAGLELDLGNGGFVAFEGNLGTSAGEYSLRDDFRGLVDEIKFESNLTYGLSAIAGTLITERTRVYLRAGYQWTDFKLNVRDNFTAPGGFSASEDDTFGGIRVGLGLETHLTRQLSLRVDWTHTMYSSETYDLVFDEVIEFEPSENIFQAGVILRF